MEIKKVCVLGAGLMGSGIAQVCAQAGFQVALRDIEQRFVDGGMNTIRKNLGREVQKSKKTQAEMDALLGRIKPTLDLKEAAGDADDAEGKDGLQGEEEGCSGAPGGEPFVEADADGDGEVAAGHGAFGAGAEDVVEGAGADGGGIGFEG